MCTAAPTGCSPTRRRAAASRFAGSIPATRRRSKIRSTTGFVWCSSRPRAIRYWTQNAEGTALGPFESWLLLRSVKTLAVRLDRQDRQRSARRRVLARSARGQGGALPRVRGPRRPRDPSPPGRRQGPMDHGGKAEHSRYP
ncbi:MAG: PLP-dependent transferase [Acidobacteria bacterium]|nr:PLP-dependent transferase [Acidobacteriota bacterium]